MSAGTCDFAMRCCVASWQMRESKFRMPQGKGPSFFAQLGEDLASPAGYGRLEVGVQPWLVGDRDPLSWVGDHVEKISSIIQSMGGSPHADATPMVREDHPCGPVGGDILQERPKADAVQRLLSDMLNACQFAEGG